MTRQSPIDELAKSVQSFSEKIDAIERQTSGAAKSPTVGVLPLKRFTPESSLAQYRTDGNGNIFMRSGSSVGPCMWPIENALCRAMDEHREQQRFADRLSCSGLVLARYVQREVDPRVGGRGGNLNFRGEIA